MDLVLCCILWLACTRTIQAAPSAPWTGESRFRVALTLTPPPGAITHRPVSCEMPFQRWLDEMGQAAPFNPASVSVAACQPWPTARRSVGEPKRVPHRIDLLYGGGDPTLHWVVPDESVTQYWIYFDTATVQQALPARYAGLVGDGDCFREHFQRREINASHFDAFADFDGDGDLDLFKGGVESFVRVYENLGGQHLADRGRLASRGRALELPHSEANRSWATVSLHDLDRDGDLDLVVSCNDGPQRGQFLFYRNQSATTGLNCEFQRVGPLRTRSGSLLAGGGQAGGWFPSVCFVDGWDRPGQKAPDALVGSGNRCWLYRGIQADPDQEPVFDDPVALQARGRDLELINPRFEVVDLDTDGDLDLLAGTQPGPVLWFQNIGTRDRPVLTNGVTLAYGGRYLIGDAHSGVKAGDWDGDGLIDFVAGRFWERSDLNATEPLRFFGGFYKNVGRVGQPRFDLRDVWQGAPYTEEFQTCDAIRQNSVRACDWDGDGRLDLLAGDTDGLIWYFHNDGNPEGDPLGPIFASGRRLRAGGQVLSLAALGGHARLDVADWNGDQRKDLLVASGQGTVMVYLDMNREGTPRLSAGKPLLLEDGRPVASLLGARASLLVCDWNEDGRMDLLLADEKGYYLCRNRGAPDAVPVLDPPNPILFGGQPVRYVRPNLGSFVDWDGDGKRDLIGCNFENEVLLYRNAGEGGPGKDPVFDDPEGALILRGEAPQMISGADVLDWNGDGDLDLLTGQGHGGSGLRYYERDWLEGQRRADAFRIHLGQVERRSP